MPSVSTDLKPREKNPFIASSDVIYPWHPVPAGAKVSFVGVGTYSSLHALSFLSDCADVVDVTIFDAYECQVDWMKRCIDILRKSRSRWDYLDDLLCCKFDRSAPVPDLAKCDVSRVSECGIDFPDNPVMPSGTGLALCQHPGPYGHRNGELSGVVMMRQTSPGRRYIGWNYGHLLEGAFTSDIPPVTYMTGALGSIGNQIIENASGDIVVFYVSNSVGWSTDWPPDRKHVDRGSTRFVRSHKHNSSVIFWGCSDDSRFGHDAILRIAKGCKQYTNRIRDPHHYTISASNRAKKPGLMVEVHASLADGIRKGQDADHIHADARMFVDGKVDESPTVMMHIVSLGGDSLFSEVAGKALSQGSRLLVLEHNKWTADRRGLHNHGLDVEDIRRLVGRIETKAGWCRGRSDLRRNSMHIFDP